jgi:tetratricopeptide (TPR) repeat protein
LFASLLGRPVLDSETQAALLARAGGNPLYAEQFARMLGESGGATELPESVQGIISARLDALPPEEKEIVQCAAVLGRVFWLGALHAVAGAERPDAEDRLHALDRKEFIRRERRATVAGESEYAFLHSLLRDVAYAQIPRAARAEMHRRAAEWVGSIAADERVDMLAHHYLAAFELTEAAGGDTGDLRIRARAALAEAAARAAALKSFRPAVRLYARALDLTPRDDRLWPGLMLQSQRAVWAGGDPADVELLPTLVVRLLAGGDVDAAAEAEVLAALSWWLKGERDKADAHMDAALDLVRERPPSPGKAEVLVERSRLSMLGGDHLHAVELGDEGLAMAEALGLERVEASALITVGTAQGNAGDVEGGIERVQRGLELARRLREPQHVQRGYNNIAQLRSMSGEIRSLVEVYRAARLYVEEYGLAGGLRWLVAQQATNSWELGDWASADRFIDEFFTRADEPHYLEPQVLVIRSHLRYARGDVDGALDDAERSRALARRAGDPQALATELGSRASLLVEEGRFEEAAAIARELDAVRNREGGFAYFTAIVWLAWLAHDLGRPELFRDPARHEVLSTPWIEAGLAVVDGDFARAADVLAEMGARTKEAYVRLRAAEELAAEGRTVEAAAQRDQALGFYRSVGASLYVSRAEALLPASA